MHRRARDAPAGAVRRAAGGRARGAGRQLLRDALPSAAPRRSDADEDKGAPPAAARAPAAAGRRPGAAAT
jgi:hypothetical protein